MLKNFVRISSDTPFIQPRNLLYPRGHFWGDYVSGERKISENPESESGSSDPAEGKGEILF